MIRDLYPRSEKLHMQDPDRYPRWMPLAVGLLAFGGMGALAALAIMVLAVVTGGGR